MILLAQSHFSLSQVDLAPGPFADSRFTVDVEGAVGDSKFSIETTDAGALGLVAPSGPQTAELIFVHAGVDHSETGLAAADPVAISMADDGITFQMSTHAFEGDEVAGAEQVAWHGYEILRSVAPPGADAIDVVLAVQIDPSDDTSVHRYPVITGGRVWDSNRALIGHDPMPLVGGSYLSRFEGRKTDIYRKLAGVGLHHGQIIIDLLMLPGTEGVALDPGIPASRIAISPTLGHELKSLYERSCFDPIAAAQEIAQAIGYFLIDDAEGNIVARVLAPVDLPPVAEINIEVLETGEVTATISARSKGLPTAIRIEGQRPEDPDAAEGFVGPRRRTSRVIRPYTTPATWSQNGSGDVSQVRAAFTEDRIISETWIQEIKHKGCLVQVRRETWEQFNPEVWRYQTASTPSLDGEPRTYRVTGGTGYLFGDSVVKDGSAAMRLHIDYQLHPVLIQQTDYIRDSEDGFSGALIRLVESVAKWDTIEDANKASTVPSKNFEEENVRANLFFFGGGRRVAGLGAGNAEEVWFEGPSAPTFDLGGTAGMGTVFRGGNASLPGEPTTMLKVAKWNTQTATDISILIQNQPGTSPRLLKFETRREIDEEGYGILNEGPTFQFSNADQSTDPTLVGRDESLTTKDFVNDGEATHAVTEIVRSGKGQFRSNTFSSGQPSALPVADICDAETAALDNTVPVFGICRIIHPDLTPRTQTITIDFGMESETAASELACRILRDETPLEVALSLPISPIFYAGAPLIFRAIHRGIDPADYINGTTKLSNAWVGPLEIQSVRDGAGVKRLLIMNLKLPIF